MILATVITQGQATAADWMQAWGAVVAALLTLGALLWAVHVGQREHASAQSALEAQHRLLREQATREHLLGVLVKVHDALTTYFALKGGGYDGSPEQLVAAAKLKVLLALVPSDELFATRVRFGGDIGRDRERLLAEVERRGYELPVGLARLGWASAEALYAEVAELTRRVADG